MTKQQLARIVFWTIISIAGTAFLLSIPKTAAYEKKTDEKIIQKDALDQWIEDLVRYECDGCRPNSRNLDINNQHSYSCLQYQEPTFREVVRLYDPELEEDQLRVLIYDCDYQKQITRALIEDKGKAASRHWYTSIYKRGLGEPPVSH